MLVLEEAGKGVFLQLLGVLHKEVIKLSLLDLPLGPVLTIVWHMDLESGNGKKGKYGGEGGGKEDRMKEVDVGWEIKGRKMEKEIEEIWLEHQRIVGPHLTQLWCQADLLIVP